MYSEEMLFLKKCVSFLGVLYNAIFLLQEMYNDCDIKTAMSQPVTNTGLIQEDLYEVG